MTQDHDARPDIDRPDAELAVVCSWQTRVGGLRVAAEALAAAWAAWPEGLRSRTSLIGADGQSLVEYAQWRDEASLIAAKPAPTMLGGATLEWQTAFRRYRSYDAGTDRAPGCVVLVRATFDAPDLERRQETIDALLGDASSEGDATPDLLGAHFHVSTDAKSILNYAEWASEAAYKAFVEGPTEPEKDAEQPENEVSDDAAQEPAFEIWAGLTGSSIRRFFVYRYAVAPGR
jgi:hypothetical protein